LLNWREVAKGGRGGHRGREMGDGWMLSSDGADCRDSS
jgi:hypothetical protein